MTYGSLATALSAGACNVTKSSVGLGFGITAGVVRVGDVTSRILAHILLVEKTRWRSKVFRSQKILFCAFSQPFLAIHTTHKLR